VKGILPAFQADCQHSSAFMDARSSSYYSKGQ